MRLQDLHPTILEAAGAAPPAGTAKDARSLLAESLAGRPLLAASHRPTVWLEEARASFPDAPERAFDRFLVTLQAHQDPAGTPGARKLVRSLRAVEGNGLVLAGEDLFDLAADPGETRDLLESGDPAERAAGDRLSGGF